MSDLKHTVLAVLSVVTVISMSAVQYSGTLMATADEAEAEMVAILSGSGEGETPEFTEEALLGEETQFETKKGYISYSAGSVNVRKEPSKTAEIVASLNLGDSFDVTGVSEDSLWYAVALPDATRGFVMCDLISFDYDAVKTEMLSTTMYETGKVSVSGGKLNVRNNPSETDSAVVSQLADGTVVYITEKTADGWLKVIYGIDYDIGYVLAKFVIAGDMVQRSDVDSAKADRIGAIAKKGTVVTTGSYVNLRNAPSESGEIIGSLKNGDKCMIISQGSKWTKLVNGSSIAYIISSAVMDDATLSDYNEKKKQAVQRASSVTAKTSGQTTTSAQSVPADASIGSKIIAEGEKYIGTKYVYGGSSPSGFDCSGFVQYVLKKVGITVNRSSRDQYKNGVAVARENLAKGDLVFFSKGGAISHVGIYAGGGRVLHSPSPGKTVCYTTLEHMCSYSTYVGARRVY